MNSNNSNNIRLEKIINNLALKIANNSIENADLMVTIEEYQKVVDREEILLNKIKEYEPNYQLDEVKIN